MEPLHQIGEIIAERYRLINLLGQGGNDLENTSLFLEFSRRKQESEG
jgi:hypothetical protein